MPISEVTSGIECKQKTEPEYLKVESKTIDSRLQLAKEREKRETYYIRDVTVSLTARISVMKETDITLRMTLGLGWHLRSPEHQEKLILLYLK